MFSGDTILSWRPQNIIFIGIVLIGWLLLFSALGMAIRRFNPEE